MKEMQTYLIWGSLLAGVMISPARADVSCTATPDCASLGYNKEAADCPEGGVKCPFNPVKMFCLKKGGGNNFSIKSKVNNLDIIYSDGTNSSSYNTAKDAIGVAIVTETGTAFNHGYVVSIHQPSAANWTQAVKRCNDYVIKGTSEGDWQLPNLMDVMMINGWETESSTGSNQYAALNAKMKTIPEAEQLGYSNLQNYCNAGSPDNGGTYLNGSPMCGEATRWQIRSGCYQNISSPYGDNVNSCYRCYNNGLSSSNCINYSNVLNCDNPANQTLTSDYYWTVSETPDSSAYPYYFKLGANNQEKAIKGGNVKGNKALYRCILRF